MSLKNGIGVDPNEQEAESWLRRSANDHNYAQAQCKLGFMLQERSNALGEAKEYFRMYAEQGYTEGQYRYGKYLIRDPKDERDQKEGVYQFPWQNQYFIYGT